jgi:hypothetical protein
MLDSTTYRALSAKKAKIYSDKAAIPLLEASQLERHARAA